jgi:hypothetical protein
MTYEKSGRDMTYLPDLEIEAANNGIDRYDVTRNGLVTLRDAALTNDDFIDAVQLSHAIWWLTLLHEAAK